MATLYLSEKFMDSPIISRSFVKRSDVTVKNSTDLAIIVVPIVVPMVTGAMTLWGLMAHGLPIENYYARLSVAIIAGLMMEFCGMMFIDYIMQASQYRYKKPHGAPDVSVFWGWIAVAVYLIIAMSILAIDAAIPAVFAFLGYSDNVRLLAPISLMGFPILTILTFVVHQNIKVINVVYELEANKEKEAAQAEAKAQQVIIQQRNLAIEQRNLESAQEQEKLALRRAELEFRQREAEIQALEVANQIKMIKAQAKVADVKPVENFTAVSTMSKEEGEVKYRELKKGNPKLSTRKAEELLKAMGCNVSHSTIGGWARKVESEVENVAQ